MTNQGQSKLAGKHVVILGAGYVGGALLRHLLPTGARLTALTRNPETAALLRSHGARVLCADLGSEAWHRELGDGADYVLNCVGSGGGGLAAYRHSYLQGMDSLLRWSSEAPVGCMVYTSSISVYSAGGGALLDEDGALATEEGPSSVLVQTEKRLLSAAVSSRRFVLRLAGIYGPGRHRFLDQLASGEAVAGLGERHLNLIHLEDILTAVLAAWSAPASLPNQVFNVVDNGAATRAEIAAWLSARLGVPAPRFTGEAAAGRSRIPPDRIISNARIKSLLGWAPIYPSFREGYEALLAARPGA